MAYGLCNYLCVYLTDLSRWVDVAWVSTCAGLRLIGLGWDRQRLTHSMRVFIEGERVKGERGPTASPAAVSKRPSATGPSTTVCSEGVGMVQLQQRQPAAAATLNMY